MDSKHTVRETNLPGLKLLSRGKVRDIYDLGDDLLIVTTDRISAFDVVMGDPIPDKGRILTPDSSRFWPKDQYWPGGPQPSFDKQFLRDYLESLDWGKTYPPPRLPPEVIAQTARRYQTAMELLTS